MNKKIITWAVLGTVCIGGSALALFADRQIAGRIQQQKNVVVNSELACGLEGADHFEELTQRESRYTVEKAYQAMDADGNLLGYVGKTTVTGYGGPIEVTAALDTEGTITGISVGGEGFTETQGLGALTKEKAFTDQFAGKTPVIVLGEDGVDSVSGASISSRAVVSGVNTIANYFYTGELGLAEESDEIYTGQTISAVQKGFGGDVTVTVGLTEDGKVEYLAIDTPDETDGLGKLASEKAFTSQFIGKTAPFQYGEDGIEALSGATVTSNAVLAALNQIVPGGENAQPAAVETESGEPTEGTAEETSAETEPAEGGDASKYMRERPAFTATEETEPEPEEEAEPAESGDALKYMRERPALTATEEMEPEPEEEAEPAESGDASKYMRERPAAVEAEVEEAETEAVETEESGPEEAEPAESGDASKYMRERPAAAKAEEAETEAVETEESEPTESGDASKYMRERPAAQAEKVEPEPEEESEPTESGDASKYMRERPAAEAEKVESEPEEETEPAESGDASKYMRERPAAAEAEEAEPEAVETEESEPEEETEPAESGDASKYMRERPAAAEAEEVEPEPAEETEQAENGDASKYMRPRPAN